MAKSKKQRKSKKSVKRDYLSNQFLIWTKIGLIILLLFIFFGSLFIIRGQRNTGFSRISLNMPLNSIASKKPVIVTLVPTSTPTPAPTSAPLTGFCLRVPVLMYHHIQPENIARNLGQTALTVDSTIFQEQMAYLAANGYTTLWASELANALITHTQLPSKSVVITMDDGYADNYTYALPVLEQYHLKANLMLATGLVDSNPDMLTWGQVQGMKNSGLYYFTNHTWSHWPVSRGPQSKIVEEISTAQTQIQQNTGQTVNIFTYPYGSFNDNAISTLRQMGYIAGFTEIPGFYQCESYLMTLHRTRVGNAPLSYYGI